MTSLFPHLFSFLPRLRASSSYTVIVEARAPLAFPLFLMPLLRLSIYKAYMCSRHHHHHHNSPKPFPSYSHVHRKSHAHANFAQPNASNVSCATALGPPQTRRLGLGLVGRGVHLCRLAHAVLGIGSHTELVSGWLSGWLVGKGEGKWGKRKGKLVVFFVVVIALKLHICSVLSKLGAVGWWWCVWSGLNERSGREGGREGGEKGKGKAK